MRDRITIYSQTKNLLAVREFITRLLSQSRLPAREHAKVTLAVDEAVANIIQHGYDDSTDGVITVIADLLPDRVAVTIQDSGVSFDPGETEALDMSEHVRQGRRRGLGIFLMRKVMDEVVYTFQEGVKNELLLVKYVTPPASPTS